MRRDGTRGNRHPHRQYSSLEEQQAKPLSLNVAARLELAKRLYNLTLEVHPVGRYQPTIRNTLFHALSDQVIEHFGAIIRLVEARQFFGSAFALLRPLIESYLRAVWTLNIATEDQLTLIAKREADFPKFQKCREAAEKFHEEHGVSGLYAMDLNFVKALHGYTHSGVEQLISRVGENLQISPYVYPEKSVLALLGQGGRFAVMAAMGCVQAIEGTPEEMSPKVEILQVQFNRIQDEYAAD